MNFDHLKTALTPDGQKTITLSKGTLTSNIDTLISTIYGNVLNNRQTAIVIKNAKVTVNDDSIDVIGTSEFLKTNISKMGTALPVKGHFSLDENNNVQMRLKYTLRDASPGPDDWIFSDSFSDLPATIDWNKPAKSASIVALDKLQLFNSSYIVSTQEQKDPDLNVPLVNGVNFVSNLFPKGILGIIESTFNQSQALTFFGPIILPTTVPVPPREPFTFPWQDVDSVPGLHLSAILSDIDLGSNPFSNFRLQIFSPISNAWLHDNSTQTPITAFTGLLTISDSAKINLVADYQYGSADLYLIGVGEGLSIANLASMTNIAGPGDLNTSLPDSLQKLVKPLSSIELKSVGLGFSLSNFPPKISYSMFSIGLTKIDWQIWEGHFELTGLGCMFELTDPFDSATRRFDVTLNAKTKIEEQEVDIYASSRDKFTLYASMYDAKIPVGQLLQRYGLDITPPSDLSIDMLRVGIAPMKSYSMSLIMASQPNSWKIPLGETDLQVSNVTLALTYPKGGPVSGNFGGELSVDGIGSFSANYSLSGDFNAFTSVPKITLNQIVQALSLHTVSLPTGFDLEFDNSYAMIQHSSTSSMFLMSTTLSDYGTVAFQALKSSETSGRWGFALGINLGTGSVAAINNTLAPLSSLLALFELQKLVMVASSFDATGFSFPGTEQFKQPAISSRKVTLPAQSNGVIAGLNIYGQWTLDTGNKKQKLLQQLLGLDPTLGITLQVGTDPLANSALYVSYSGKLMDMPLVAKVGARMRNKVPEFFVSGSLIAKIQKSDQTFTVTMLFTPNGAFAAGTMQGDKPVDFYFENVKVFSLGNLAVELGVSYEGVPAVGLAGTIFAKNFMSSIAVFFDSSSPGQSMVAGAVSDLHMGDVLETLTGGYIPSEIDKVLNEVSIEGTHSFTLPGSILDSFKKRDFVSISQAFAQVGITIPSASQQILLGEGADENTWFLTNLADNMRHYQLSKSGDTFTVEINAQMYCAPQATAIGEMHFDPGFYLNGKLNFFGLYVTATIEVNPGKGIAVDAQMSEIILGDKNLFSISAAQGSGGPIVSISTFSQPSQPVPEFRDPHFYVNGQVTILGLSRSVFVNINNSGASFDLKGDLLPGGIITGELDGTFDSLTNANVKGDVKVAVNTVDLGPLGKFDINTGAAGSLGVSINGSTLGAGLTAGFVLGGDYFNLPKISINVKTGSLAELPSMVFNAIKDFLVDLFTDPKKWVEYAKKVLGWAENELSKVLGNVFGLDPADIKKVLDEVLEYCPLTSASNFL